MFNTQVTEWHKKMEEARLQELRKGRELVVQKEEIRFLKKLVEEQERTIRSLEEDIVQQNTVRERKLTDLCREMCREVSKAHVHFLLFFTSSFKKNGSSSGISERWSWSAKWTSMRSTRVKFSAVWTR